jgi:hypothetical protein
VTFVAGGRTGRNPVVVDNSWINHQYFRTYQIADFAEAVSTDAHFLEGLVVDGGIDAFVKPWQKHSALHRFVAYVTDHLFSNDCNGPRLILVEHDWRDRRHLLPVDYALELYGLQDGGDAHVPDLDLLREDPTAVSNAAYEYFTEELRPSAVYDALLQQLADEVFYVMFANRGALAALNGYLASAVQGIEGQAEGLEHLFEPSGVLKRKAPPPWARRAVFFREQGLCAICRTDLSPHRTPHSMRRYDHIVPLAAGGLNDITNLQLLCRACNLTKSADRLLPSADYRRWYGM